MHTACTCTYGPTHHIEVGGGDTPLLELRRRVARCLEVMYVCICMYMYVYVCICMCVDTWRSCSGQPEVTYVCICMYMYVYVCICMYMYVYGYLEVT